MRFLIFILALLGFYNKRGIAMAYPNQEDLDRTHSSWWYVWGTCHTSGCVPMSYAGEDPLLLPGYDGFILLFNEPNNAPPYGAHIEPSVAVEKYLSLVEKYPHAKFIVGNVSLWASNWLREFKANLPDAIYLPYAWGIHAYVEAYFTPEVIMQYLEDAHKTLGGKFWITEWADTKGNVTNDIILERYFNDTSWIERHAYFTNRIHGNEEWYPAGWNVPMFDENGYPTVVGRYFMSKANIFLPVLER